MEVRRVRGGPSGGRQSSASSAEAGDLSPQCQSCGFCGDGATCTSRSRSFSQERLYACLSLTQLRPLNSHTNKPTMWRTYVFAKAKRGIRGGNARDI